MVFPFSWVANTLFQIIQLAVIFTLKFRTFTSAPISETNVLKIYYYVIFMQQMAVT